MADVIDQAQELNEMYQAAALANRQRPTGAQHKHCLNCQAPLTDRINFCDTDCRDDHERRAGRRRHNTAAFD